MVTGGGYRGLLMNRHLTARAVDRARWFAELSAALDKGQRVLAQLAAEGAEPVETERLWLRLIELRAELGRLNRVSLNEERIVGPKWPDETSNMVKPSPEVHPDWLPRRG